ncbi:MAG: hypothetical protein P8Y70_17480 [Candidatus Lokiarchaeota archaeon]
MNQYFLFGSRKFNEKIKELTKNLKNTGFSVNSTTNVPFKEIKNPSQFITNKKYIEEEILNASIILIYNEEDDIDLSTAMNLQYAISQKKLIKLIFDTKREELTSLCKSLYYNVEIDTTWQKYCNKEDFNK